MDLRFMKRLALIVMALFPALWGLIGDLNNATDFKGTATNAVAPMIAMTNTYGNPLQIWRAITAPWAAEAGLALIMAAETAAGVFGAISIIIMIANLRGSARGLRQRQGMDDPHRACSRFWSGASDLWWLRATGSSPGRRSRIRFRPSSAP